MTFHVERLLAAFLIGLLAACQGASPRRQGATAGLPAVGVTLPGPGVELAGLFYTPETAGPFPAVVLLHGCSGMWRRDGRPNASYDHWARELRAAGYVALLLDSFVPRGEDEICTHENPRVLPGRDRARDAHAARRWLADRPEVRPSAIHVLGWSNGGTAVLHALRPDAPGRRPGEDGFRSGIAFYPGCRPLAAAGTYQPAAPLLIQAGELDDWTPSSFCVALARGAAEIDVYPGAHHGFDRLGEAGPRFRPDVRNPGSSTGRGATIEAHPEARRSAWERVFGFLRRAE